MKGNASMENLTPAEIELVQNLRDQKARQASMEAFQRKAIATANDFAAWSDETGQGLTFSTFIDSFDYQDNDGKAMYEAVKRINDAAWPQQ